jgi:poly-gamma-glutamate synthesis protein (capsule biosynthesis protein)
MMSSLPAEPVTLFLSGDVMTGRGIDQALPHPGDPTLFEQYVKSAAEYLAMAEARNGPLRLPFDYGYPWGDTLGELGRVMPDARIINLETSVTTSDDRCRRKEIHYRMNPANVSCLTAARIDCCVLANNHVLDWGTAGLEETLDTLVQAGVATAGAGRNLGEATAPAVLEIPQKGRVLVFAHGMPSSGIPRHWCASERRPGVNLVSDLSPETVRVVTDRIRAVKEPGDIAIVSIHWGPNWGYTVPWEHQQFAHRLIDEAGADVVHGHSSHHPLGIEVYRNRPIFYGCGDLFNDYEGIRGYEEFRDDLVLAYFPSLDPREGNLVGLEMSPFQIRRFRLNRTSSEDAEWLRRRLAQDSAAYGTRVESGPGNTLILRWT